MVAVNPSAQSVYIPDHEASGALVVDYARDPKKFAVTRYAQIVPVKKTMGYYLRMTVEEAGRIIDTNLDNFVWPDGNSAPEFNNETESHEFLPFLTRRMAFGFNLGTLTVDQASWDIVAQHGRIKAQQAMTGRTQKVLTAALTEANHTASHVLTVTGISGNTGTWAQSTTARQDIKRSLQTAMELILDDTLVGVRQEDMILVINSALAAKLTQCQEVVDYIKGSPEALAQVRGELTGSNTMYGLPDKLYGFNLVVEATRKVTTRKGATTARSQILPTANALLLSRPGGLVGVEGAPSFSSLQVFAFTEMQVEKLDDVNNKRVVCRIIENYDVKLVAPAASVMFKACA